MVIDGRRYGPFFAALLANQGLAPSQVVVEILESDIGDRSQLAEAVGYYRDLGCLVAIDDFGAGHSNFDRIMQLEPDMVKLDRSLIRQASDSATARRMLPSLVALLHEAGSLVVVEGIESEREAVIALDAGADFAQGYHFARPAPATAQLPVATALFDTLAYRSRTDSAVRAAGRTALLRPYISALEQCAVRYADGADFATAAATLLTQAEVIRTYRLDHNGIQIGSNLSPGGSAPTTDPRFSPLLDTAGCDWSGRPYFRRAINAPHRVQTSRPYLSITGADLTITLSVAILREGQWQVVCCDLRYIEPGN